MRALLVVLLVLLGTATAAAQDASSGVRAALGLLLTATAPSRLFSYAVETTVSFNYRGNSLSSRQAYDCEVVHDRGTIDVKRDRIVGVTAGSDSPHFLLRDGTALVLFDFNPCSWTRGPPASGTAYTLVPVARSDQPPADPGKSRAAEVMGSVAVLDNAKAAKHIQTYDLASFAGAPEVADFKIAAKVTTASPTNTLVADIPALAAAAAAVSQPFPGPKGPVGGALFFQVTPVTKVFHPDDAAGRFAKFAGGKHWVLVEGAFGQGEGKSATIAIGDDPGKIDIDLKTAAPTSAVGVMLPWAAGKLPTQPMGTLEAWRLDICIEGDCLKVSKLPAIFGGVDTSLYTLYHPPTGRMAALAISTDDLTRLLTSDELSSLFH